MSFVQAVGGRVARAAESHAAAAAEWLWPSACPACGDRPERAREQFCAACWARLRALTPEDACWVLPAGAGGPVLPVRAVYAVDAHFVAVLGASKYRGARSVGRRLCREAAARLQLPAEPGWLLAVPLTAAKLRSRGFNQPQDFVRALVARGGEEATPLLERCRGGPSSAGRARADRERTVAGAFRVGRAHVPPLPSRILLVDDVVTTGSTARACATVLREAGVSSVEVLALARAFESAADRAPASRDALERL